MLEVCKTQEHLGGYFVWNFNQPVGHTRDYSRKVIPLLFPKGWEYQCGYLTNSKQIDHIMNPKADGYEFDEQQVVFESAWDEVLSNLMRKGDVRKPDGKCFRSFPKKKRHILKSEWGKAEESDRLEAKLPKHLEHFSLQKT